MHGGWILGLIALSQPSLAQTTTRISIGPLGVQGDGNSRAASISADGRYVAFGSAATSLVSGDTNVAEDVFVTNRQSGITTRVSVDSAGTQGDAGSFAPAISSDGRYVAFHSFAANLVAGDTNGASDIFVHDRTTGTTTRASVDSTGAQAHGDCFYPSISADGRFVAFQSLAADLVAGDANGHEDVFVRDLQSGTTLLASIGIAGVGGDDNSLTASISADGRIVAFDSAATNLVAGDTNATSDVFVRDLSSGTTERVSVGSAGGQGNASSYSGSISADGRFVAFYGAASNLVPFDTNGAFDVFVRNRQPGATAIISVSPVGRVGNRDSFTPSISADGRFVAFQSVAFNLVSGDSNGTADVFVRDLQAERSWRVSVGANLAQADSYSAGPSITADGRNVAFYSEATNLVPEDTNGHLDVFVHDRECSGVDPSTPFCSGDGTSGPCPCGNGGGGARGCANSFGGGGARLDAGGSTSANPVTGTDSLVLCADGMPSTVIVMLIQGNAMVAAGTFGDGLRCTGGVLRLLATRMSQGGRSVYPQAGDLPISQRSASLGDPILGSGSTRYYQTYYRDPDPAYCPAPQGSTSNITNGLILVW